MSEQSRVDLFSEDGTDPLDEPIEEIIKRIYAGDALQEAAV